MTDAFSWLELYQKISLRGKRGGRDNGGGIALHRLDAHLGGRLCHRHRHGSDGCQRSRKVTTTAATISSTVPQSITIIRLFFMTFILIQQGSRTRVAFGEVASERRSPFCGASLHAPPS